MTITYGRNIVVNKTTRSAAQKLADRKYAKTRFPISTAQGTRKEADEFRQACESKNLTQKEALRLLLDFLANLT